MFGYLQELRSFVATLPDLGRILSMDRVLHAMAALHVHDGDYLKAKPILRENCFPTYVIVCARDLTSAFSVSDCSHCMGSRLLQTQLSPIDFFWRNPHQCAMQPTPMRHGDKPIRIAQDVCILVQHTHRLTC